MTPAPRAVPGPASVPTPVPAPTSASVPTPAAGPQSTSGPPPAAAPRLVLLDFDGTLADRAVMPRAHVEALARAREGGHRVVLSTGRPLSILPDALLAQFDGLITSAGAHVEMGGTVLAETALAPDLARRAVEVLRAHEVLFLLEASDALYSSSSVRALMRPEMDRFASSRADAERIFAMLRTPDDPAARRFAKISVWHSPVSVEALSDEIGPGLRPLPNSVSEAGRHSGELQMTDVDKADGLRLVAEHVGCGIEATVGIGDGMNDVGMLAAAGTAVAIEGGPAALMRHADLVVPGPREHGVARALETLGLT